VVNYSRNAQHPQYGKIRNPNLDKGDFIFVLPKAATEPKPTPTPAPESTLTVRSNVYDDEVYIDGKFKGTTRLTVNLRPGTHSIRVEKQGYTSASRRINLTSGERKTIRFKLKPIKCKKEPKRYCNQMKSCDEAKFYLSKCGISSLDGDQDGNPCESLCLSELRKPRFSCDRKKRYCNQMKSCDEAKFYLSKCGIRSLDRDQDGKPCESLCR